MINFLKKIFPKKLSLARLASEGLNPPAGHKSTSPRLLDMHFFAHCCINKFNKKTLS